MKAIILTPTHKKYVLLSWVTIISTIQGSTLSTDSFIILSFLSLLYRLRFVKNFCCLSFIYEFHDTPMMWKSQKLTKHCMFQIWHTGIACIQVYVVWLIDTNKHKNRPEGEKNTLKYIIHTAVFSSSFICKLFIIFNKSFQCCSLLWLLLLYCLTIGGVICLRFADQPIITSLLVQTWLHFSLNFHFWLQLTGYVVFAKRRKKKKFSRKNLN